MTLFEDEELLTHIRSIVTQYLKEHDGYTGEFSLHIEQVSIEQVDLDNNYGEPEFDMTDWVEAVYEVKVKRGNVVDEYPLYIGIPHPQPFLLPSNTERNIPWNWKRPAWAMVTPRKRMSDAHVQLFEGFARRFTYGVPKVITHLPNGVRGDDYIDTDIARLLPLYEKAGLIETKYLGNSPWEHWEITLKELIEEEEEKIPEEEWVR